MKKCPKCGAGMEDDDGFCTKCGYDFSDKTTVEKESGIKQIDKKLSRYKVRIFALIIMATIVAVTVVVVNHVYFQPAPEGNRPVVAEFLDRTCVANGDGVFVNLSIRNVGGDGVADVRAYVEQGETRWEKQQLVYIRNGETKDLEFVFTDPEYGAEFTYGAYAKPWQ